MPAPTRLPPAATPRRRRLALPALLVLALPLVVRADIDGYYYDQNAVPRAYFTGNVVHQVDSNVDFNFGNASPPPLAVSDDFSILWLGDLVPSVSGSYRFETQSDDGVRVYLDGVLIIDNWTDHGPTIDSSGTVNLAAGQRYLLRMEYFERGGGSVARLRWDPPGGGGATAIPAGNLELTTLRLAGADQGCGTDQVVLHFSRPLDQSTAEDIGNYAFSGGALAVTATLDANGVDVNLTVSGLNPAGHTITVNNVEDADGTVLLPNTQVTSVVPSNGLNATYFDQNAAPRAYFTGVTYGRVDPEVNFDWGSGAPAPGIGTDDFTVRWYANVTPPTTGNYRFETRSDDGVRLYVDGNLVIENWTDHSPTNDQSPDVFLTGGQAYDLVMEFYERAGGAVAELRWDGPGFPQQVIPNAALTPICGVPPLPDPVAAWRMEEAQWNGLPGEVTDQTGNGHDGTSLNTPLTEDTAPAIPGDPGTCRYGSFSAAAAEAVVVPHTPEINPAGSFTLAAWVRVTGRQGEWRSPFASRLRANASTRLGYNIYAGTNDVWAFWTGPGTGSGWDAMGGGAVTVGDWTHIAATFEATEQQGLRFRGTKRLYVNGILVASLANRAYQPNTSADAFIGAGGDGLGNVFFWEGDIDEVRIYDAALTDSQVNRLMAETHPCAGGVDHYAISHAPDALTCEAEALTISGHNAATPVHGSFAPESTIIISTTPPSAELQLKSGTPGNFVGGTGAARYTFAPGETAVELWVRQTTPAILDFDVVDGSNVREESGEDSALEFRDTGLRFYADGLANGIASQVASKASDVHPSAQAIELRAVQKNTDTGACETRLVPTPIDVELAYECNSPATCALASGLTVNGTAIAGNPGGAVTAFQAVPLDFGGGTAAALVLDYADAGEITLHARLSLPDQPPAPPLELVGTSNPFVVRPAGLCVEALQPAADCASADTGCSVFRRAGETFALRIRGVGWQTPGESNDDFCSGNATTPNYQAAGITLSPARVAPASGGVDGQLALASASIVSNGAITQNSQALREVGVFTVEAVAPPYFGEVIAPSRSANIGRFVPAYLEVTANTPALAPACGTFTYQDQPFHYLVAPTLTVEARATSGQPTLNYRDDFYRLTTSLPRSYNDQAGATASFAIPTVDGDVTVTGQSDLDGTATLALDGDVDGDVFVYRRVAPEAPFAAAIDLEFSALGLTDADGACYDPEQDNTCNPLEVTAIAGTGLRFGRVRLSSAFGSELLPLDLPLVAEYYDGSAWLTNAADGCTVLDLGSEIALSNPATGGGAAQPGSTVMSLGGGSSQVGSGNPALLSGRGSLQFTPPGASNTGFIDVTTDLAGSRDWLLFDWDGDGTFDDDTAARASFGLFPGRDEMIYVREPWD